MRRTLLTLAAAVATLTSAATVHAGTYVVTACGAAGGINSSWSFERSSTVMRTTDLCAGGTSPDDDLFTTFTPALGIRTDLGQPQPPVGTYGYIRIDAPAPLMIVGYRRSFHMHSESDSWRLVLESEQGELWHCQSNEPGGGVSDFCDSGVRGGTSPLDADFVASPISVTPTSWLRLGTRCVLSPCHTGTSAHAASTALFAAAVWVNDPGAPAASLAGVPAELPSGAGVTATVRGSDQTGIRRLELLVDGQVVAGSDRACNFRLVLPCELPGGQVLAQLATPGLSPGVHSLVARAIDASGNVASSSAAAVTVKAPVQPTTPPTTPPITPPQTTPPGTTPPGTTPPAGRRAAMLRIKSVSRSGSKVRVRGSLGEGCRSRLKVVVSARGKTRTVRITAPRSGRWGVTVAGVRRGGKARVKVVASSSKVCLPADRSRQA